ncbi:hypothetical protein ACJIZ3_008505 [Penstemon smallii]|uniref:Uncharacterized protein n=1 Tax=Penstemon smallii TaxID=265156 RepID=A0ABD3T9Y1_9LAMI
MNLMSPIFFLENIQVQSKTPSTSEEEANGPTMEEVVRSFEVAMLITATKGKGLGKGLQIFLFSQLKHMEGMLYTSNYCSLLPCCGIFIFSTFLVGIVM